MASMTSLCPWDVSEEEGKDVASHYLRLENGKGKDQIYLSVWWLVDECIPQ